MGIVDWIKKKRMTLGRRSRTSSASSKDVTTTTNATKNDQQKVPYTANEALVAKFAEMLTNQQDIRELFAENVDILFEEAPMTLTGFQEEMKNVYKSFPDFAIRPLGDITELPDGTVRVLFCVTGTHTGAPYGFGPYPAIDTTGIAIRLDAEECHATIRDGKITNYRVKALGEHTGPAGAYMQIGGLVF